jgi:uncharacterized damage-inducible protein DinB
MIKDFAAYNVWANEQLIEICKRYPELLEQEVASSFPTIRRTLLHIYDAELGWFNRIRGVSHTQFPSTTFVGDNQDVFETVLGTSKEFNAHVQAQDDTYFTSVCDYKTTKGDLYDDTYGEIITHVVNHSTYHRGQVVTMLRGLGAKQMQPMDYIWYLRFKK